MIGMTWLRLHSSDPKARRRALADLGGRDAVREAEEIVSAQWISTLEASTAADAVTFELLEREKLTYAHAGRRRARAAERDRRRLTVLIRSEVPTGPSRDAVGAEDSVQTGEDGEAIRPSHVDGSSGTA
jgi:hypothetical protein